MDFDLSFLTIPHQILQEKLLLFHYISTLTYKAILKKVLQIQQKYDFPGLHREVKAFIIEHEIEDVTKFTKKEWKNLVTRKVHDANRKYLINASRKYKKIDYLDMATEEYKVKEYFTNLDLNRARIKFQERASTMVSCTSHLHNDEKFLKGGYFCPYKEDREERKIMSLFHWRECSLYAHLRISRNLDQDADLTSYYNDIINLRVKD